MLGRRKCELIHELAETLSHLFGYYLLVPCDDRKSRVSTHRACRVPILMLYAALLFSSDATKVCWAWKIRSYVFGHYLGNFVTVDRT